MKTEIRISNYSNGQKWWHHDGSLQYLTKWHKAQMVWRIYLSPEEQAPSDAEVELFFHPTKDL